MFLWSLSRRRLVHGFVAVIVIMLFIYALIGGRSKRCHPTTHLDAWLIISIAMVNARGEIVQPTIIPISRCCQAVVLQNWRFLKYVSTSFVMPSGTWKKLNAIQSIMCGTDPETLAGSRKTKCRPFLSFKAFVCSRHPEKPPISAISTVVSTKLFFTKKAESLWARPWRIFFLPHSEDWSDRTDWWMKSFFFGNQDPSCPSPYFGIITLLQTTLIWQHRNLRMFLSTL